MTHNRAELLKQSLITAIKSDDDKITFSKRTVKDIYELIYCLQYESELYNKKLKERQAEIEELNVELVGMRGACNSYKMHYDNAQTEIENAHIGVKSYKGKYESAVKATKELQTVIKEKEAEIDTLKIQNEHLSTFWRNTQAEVDKLIEEADQFADLGKMYSEIRAEAIKEFEKRFENNINEIDFPKYAVLEKVLTLCKQIINETAKEMVGEDK